MSIIPLWLKGAILGLLLASLTGAGYYLKGALDERTELRQQVASQQEQLKLAERFQKVTTVALTKRVAAVAAIKERANNVQVEIERLIPAGPVAGCLLPPAFRLLHDAAANDEPVPDPASSPDATAATVKEAAKTITGNYETYHDIANQLELLQLWVDGVSRGQIK